jgi:hypothetical protein
MSSDRHSSGTKPPVPREDASLARGTAQTSGRQRAKASDRIPVAARCSVLGDAFAIVFRPGRGTGKRWFACDTYPLVAAAAETVDPPQPPPRRIRLIGEIILDGGYPGCPHCAGHSFLLCSLCRGYVCTGAAKVTGDDLTYCPTCDYFIRIGQGQGLRDAEATTAPPAKVDRTSERLADSGRGALPGGSRRLVHRES